MSTIQSMSTNIEWLLKFRVDPTITLCILIAIVVLHNVWNIILAQRQVIVCKEAIFMPEALREVIRCEDFERARTYELHSAQLQVWKHFVDVLIKVGELYFGFYPFLWNLAVGTLSGFTDREIWISPIFSFMFSIYFFLRKLPIFIYDWSMQELFYGTVRRVSCGTFLCWATFGLTLAQLILAPATMLIVFLVQSLGYYFFVYFWILLAALMLFLLFIIPLCIVSVLGQQQLVPQGALFDELNSVTAAAGFSMQHVRIVRSRTKYMRYSNAYFYGCGCHKRILIFSTMLRTGNADARSPELGLTHAQVAGVVAHELGHWRHGHFYKSVAIVKLHLLFTVLLFGVSFHAPHLFEGVHFAPGVRPVIVGILICFHFALTPYFTLANFLMLCSLRRYEFEADRFAHQLGYSTQLCSALLKLYADNVSYPVYDRCYLMWHHTHPSVLQRLGYQLELDMRAMQEFSSA